jgi:hypothetical protein
LNGAFSGQKGYLRIYLSDLQRTSIRWQRFELPLKKVIDTISFGEECELSSIVVDEGFCQAAASWDLTPSVN